MTVIACRNGIMAADSGVWQDGICVGHTVKIRRLDDGSLAAAAGSRPIIQKFHLWLESKMREDLKPRKQEDNCFGALWLRRDGIFRVSPEFDVYDDVGEFAAEGMSINFMLGVMAHGGSAEEAVRLVLAYRGEGAIGDIQVERLEQAGVLPRSKLEPKMPAGAGVPRGRAA